MSVLEVSREAARCCLAALDGAHSRVQVNIRSTEEPLMFGLGDRDFTPLCEVLNYLVHSFAGRNETIRLFFSSVPLAEHACDVMNLESDMGQIHVDVLSVGSLQREDDCAIVVTPANGGVAEGTHVITSIQHILLRANKRSVILVNPELEALVSWDPGHRAVAPMFLSDFEPAFHFECSRGSIDGEPHTLAVHRAYPGDWRILAKADGASHFHTVHSTSRMPRRSQVVDCVRSYAEAWKGPRPRSPRDGRRRLGYSGWQ